MVGSVEDEVATQILGVTLGQRDTETKTLGEIIDLGEELEDDIAIGLVNAFALVFDDEADNGIGSGDAPRDVLAVGILGCVVKDFAQGAHEIDAAGLDTEVVGYLRLKVDGHIGIVLLVVADGLARHVVARYTEMLLAVELFGKA